MHCNLFEVHRSTPRLHLPMLFQLAPQAVSDLFREAQAADDDTVSVQRFLRTARGWGFSSPKFVTTSTTVDSGHHFFFGADSVHIGACEIRADFASMAVSRC